MRKQSKEYPSVLIAAADRNTLAAIRAADLELSLVDAALALLVAEQPSAPERRHRTSEAALGGVWWLHKKARLSSPSEDEPSVPQKAPGPEVMPSLQWMEVVLEPKVALFSSHPILRDATGGTSRRRSGFVERLAASSPDGRLIQALQCKAKD